MNLLSLSLSVSVSFSIAALLPCAKPQLVGGVCVRCGLREVSGASEEATNLEAAPLPPL